MRHDKTAARLYTASEQADRKVVEAVNALALALARGLPPAQVALASLLQRGGVMLDDGECAALERAYTPHGLMSFFSD